MKLFSLCTVQTSSQRFSLIDTLEKPRAELAMGEVLDNVIDHEIKELGVQTLAPPFELEKKKKKEEENQAQPK